MRGRLNNLGFRCFKKDGDPDYGTDHALRAFQVAAEIEVTGAFDETTKTEIVRRHGS